MSDKTPLEKANASPGADAQAQSKEVRRAFKRVPLSTPQLKLAVPEDAIPGHHLHWFRESNVPRAKQAGYELVTMEEVPVNQIGLANSGSVNGSTDLGGNVTIISGTSEHGAPERLVLMKQRQEWWDEDRKAFDDANEARLTGIFREEKIVDRGPTGSAQQTPDDVGKRYVSKALFNRPKRVSKAVKGS